MKRTLYFIICFGFLLLWSSCRKDFDFSPSTGSLEFSKDTVFLDTVFSNISSSTYNLRVYNSSNEDIIIPSISLQRGQGSEYRLNIDGIAGKDFSNVELLAKDSLFIFVETTIDFNNFSNPSNEFLYTDKIEFDSGSNLQNVELVTLVKDAVLIFPDRDANRVVETLTLTIDGMPVETEIQGRVLEASELTFTNDKPYLIYGYAAVPSGETLTVNAGARVHFHEDSGLIVPEGASLQVNGAISTDEKLLENEVIFEGDRLESIFENTPGQWGTIWLFNGSENNVINHATIKNATVGILVDGNPDAPVDKLTISNSQIYNSSLYGLFGRNTSIKGENLVVNNAGQVSLAATLGGKYNFTHSTIANYWTSGPRQSPALLVNNFIIDAENTPTTRNLVEANFNNCIIYGNDNPEFIVIEATDPSVVFNFKFTNCLARFEDVNDVFTDEANYDFNDTTKYENVIRNLDPNFRKPGENDLIIGEDSPANAKGNPIFSAQVPSDILGVNRTASPDLGAYQHVMF